jgi:predicted CXXCH cytochrome family protein
VFVWGSFVQSRMHAAGVTCSDCHEPHSGQLRAPGNAVCAQCHEAATFDTPAHHHHDQGARGAQCVDCHMPATTYMLVDPRRDHSLRVPRPDRTTTLGTPNACNDCHKDRSPEWADGAIERWYGHRPQGFQTFAEVFAAARRGANVNAELGNLLRSPGTPALVRATAANALQPWLDTATLPLVGAAANDVSPLVRREAARLLVAVPPAPRLELGAALLDDPRRLVRMEAAVAFADIPDAMFSESQRASFARAAAEFEQSQRYNADRPEQRVMLGNFYARQGRAVPAESEFWAALALDRSFVQAYANLAELQRALGREADAETTLRAGLERVPDDASLHHALGLSLVRQQRLDAALVELRRAAALQPGDARFAYVYAVALHTADRRAEALRELDRAIALHPDDRDLQAAAAAWRAQ